MPIIYTTQYRNTLEFTEFKHANFVKKSGLFYDVKFMGDKFYQFMSGYWYAMTSGATGFTYPNISNKLTQTSEQGMARNNTNGRLFLHAIADGALSGPILKSDDLGATWQNSLAQTAQWNSIATNHNNVVIATGLYTSGGSWVAATRRSLDNGNNWSDISAQAGGGTQLQYLQRLNMFMMASNTGVDPLIRYSTDNGTTWTGKSLTDTRGLFRKVIDTGTTLISSTSTQTTTNAYPVRTSSDGINWTAVYGRGTPPNTSFSDLAYGNGVLVGVLSNKNSFYYSTDNGTTWAPGTLPNNAVCSNVEFGNNQFIFGTNTVAEYYYYTM